MASTHFDWLGYFALSARLAAELGEAERRSAISRAYYYAYNAARLKTPTVPKRWPGGERIQHTGYWRLLESGGHGLQAAAAAALPGWVRTVGPTGLRLLGQRQNADYESGYPISDRYVQAAIQLATDIKTEIER